MRYSEILDEDLRTREFDWPAWARNRRRNYVLVDIDPVAYVEAFDKYQPDMAVRFDYYHDHENDYHHRKVDRLVQWLETNPTVPVETPDVGLDDRGNPYTTDGRH